MLFANNIVINTTSVALVCTVSSPFPLKDGIGKYGSPFVQWRASTKTGLLDKIGLGKELCEVFIGKDHAVLDVC